MAGIPRTPPRESPPASIETAPAPAFDGLAHAQPADGARARQPLELLGWVALIALGPALLVYLSFNAGGYFPSANGIAAVVLAQALVVRTLAAGRPFEGFSRALSVPLLALALYAGWQLTSLLWSHATARTLDAYDRTLLYVLALALFGSVRYTAARLRWLLRGVFAGLALVCLAGLVSRVLPHVWPTGASFAANRLDYPLTYWNAEGMLAAIALIVGVHLSADPGERQGVRVLAAGVLPVLAATLLFTFSRGSLAVTVVGLLAYCAVTRAHTVLATALAAAAPCAIALRAAYDATLLASTDVTSPAALVQGRHVALIVGLCALGAAALRGGLLFVDDRLAALPIVRNPPRLRLRVGVGGGAVAFALAGAVALGGVGFAHDQLHRFVHGTGATDAPVTRTRLAEVSNNGRLTLWKAALRIYRTEELHGTGAGTYQLYYTRYRSEPLQVADAHSLYLQSLAELGLVGLALILLVVVGMLAGLAVRVRGPDRGLYAVVLAVTLGWAIHQAIDWDWQMPAVTLGVFALAALALARPRDRRAGLAGLPAARVLVAIGWLAVAVSPLLASISYGRLHRSSQELVRGNCPAAKHDALSSLSLSASRPQAYAIVGVCDLELGYARQAVPAMAQAAALEPQNWEDQYWLAVARAGAGVDPHAAIARAIALNPLEGGLRRAAERLRSDDPRSWERVAPRLRVEALDSGKFQITSL